MPSGFTDTPMAVRAIGTRTDSGGIGVTDLSAEEERMANIFVAEGYISPSNAFVVAADSSWNLTVGSGPTDVDYYVIEGNSPGQGNYIVRLDQIATTVTIDSADLSNPRWDEVYLVVMDDAYDSSGLSLPRLAVREGDPAASPEAPGPAGVWTAYALLAQVYVPAGAADITECTVYDLRSQAQSNVDTQTLEGNAASAFALTTHNHDADYAPGSHEDSTDGHPLATAGDDGMMSFSDKSKLNAIEVGAEANLTASEILALIRTVDGSGSGLNADLLDGQHASYYASSGHNHDSRYYTESEVNSILSPLANDNEQAFMRRNSNHLTNSGIEGIVGWYAADEVRDDWDGHFGNDSYVKDGKAGYYLVEAQYVFSAHSGGTVRQIRIHHSSDGNVAIGREKPVTSSGEATVVRAHALVHMNGSQVIRLYAYQDSGASINGQADQVWLRMTYLGGG